MKTRALSRYYVVQIAAKRRGYYPLHLFVALIFAPMFLYPDAKGGIGAITNTDFLSII